MLITDKVEINLNKDYLSRRGSFFVYTRNAEGDIVAITRFALLHLGEDGRDVIEIRTETKNGNTEQRVEVSK